MTCICGIWPLIGAFINVALDTQKNFWSADLRLTILENQVKVAAPLVISASGSLDLVDLHGVGRLVPSGTCRRAR